MQKFHDLFQSATACFSKRAITRNYPYIPVVPQKFPGFAVGVAQVHTAHHAGGVQVSQVGDVGGVFGYFLFDVVGKVRKCSILLLLASSSLYICSAGNNQSGMKIPITFDINLDFDLTPPSSY